MDDKVYEIKESAIADPGALGLAGFAMTTMALSAANAAIVPAALGLVFVPLALYYGGAAQVLAGMWEFKKNHTFGSTAFTTYGMFWIALATMILFTYKYPDMYGKGNAALGTALGFFLLLFTIFTFYMWIGSFRTNNALLIVFTTLLLAFIFLTWGALAPAPVMTKIGGWLGLICGASAWYTSAASVINSTYKKVVLPVGPRNAPLPAGEFQKAGIRG